MKFKLLAIGLVITCACFAQNSVIQKRESEFILDATNGNNNVDASDTGFMARPNELINKLKQLLLLPGADKYDFAGLKKMGTGIVGIHSSADGRVRLFSCFFGPGSWDEVSLVQYTDNTGHIQCQTLNAAEEGEIEINVDSVIVVAPDCYLLFGGVHCGFECTTDMIGYMQIEGAKLNAQKKVFEQGAAFEHDIILHYEADNKKLDARKMEYYPLKKQLCYTNPDGPDVCLTFDGRYFKKATH